MIRLLAKRLIGNYDNYTDAKVREGYGVLCGAIGIILNLLLFLGKFVAGTISNSIAVISDAFNNLSDSGSSLISMIGFKFSGKKPDPDHPFGHGRFEYIAGLIVSLLILLMGFELATSSVQKLFAPQKTMFSWLTVGILAGSILVKFYMLIYNLRIGKKINSAAMRSTGIDCLSDCISTTVVLLCTLLSPIVSIPLDAWCGVGVSAFILIAGFRAAMDTVNPLLGTPPEPEFVQQIRDIVLSHPDVVGIHDLIVHNYGPGRRIISLHAEVPCDADMLTIHEVIDDIETDLSRRLNCLATIHMDPIATNDPKTLSYKILAAQAVKELEGNISMHDFRVVHGTGHTNLIFDVVLPFGYRLSDEQVRQTVSQAVSVKDASCRCVINIDRDYSFSPGER